MLRSLFILFWSSRAKPFWLFLSHISLLSGVKLEPWVRSLSSTFFTISGINDWSRLVANKPFFNSLFFRLSLVAINSCIDNLSIFFSILATSPWRTDATASSIDPFPFAPVKTSCWMAFSNKVFLSLFAIDSTNSLFISDLILSIEIPGLSFCCCAIFSLICAIDNSRSLVCLLSRWLILRCFFVRVVGVSFSSNSFSWVDSFAKSSANCFCNKRSCSNLVDSNSFALIFLSTKFKYANGLYLAQPSRSLASKWALRSKFALARLGFPLTFPIISFFAVLSK